MNQSHWLLIGKSTPWLALYILGMIRPPTPTTAPTVSAQNAAAVVPRFQ